jgi:hypothetical protein
MSMKCRLVSTRMASSTVAALKAGMALEVEELRAAQEKERERVLAERESRSISWADLCSSGSDSGSDSDEDLPPLEEEDDDEVPATSNRKPEVVSRLHPLHFEPPQWPPHSPTLQEEFDQLKEQGWDAKRVWLAWQRQARRSFIERALSNYEAFHRLPAGYADVFEVTRSCAGLVGWAAWVPPRLAEELQLAFAMGTHARLGSGGQGCPYLMMPAELVERVVEACTIAMPRGAVARAHGLTVGRP